MGVAEAVLLVTGEIVLTLPNLLIIGAMKGGTTSVFKDLVSHPAVFCPLDKEPEDLVHDKVLAIDGLRAYEQRYIGARGHDVVVDASTAYSKLPIHSGVAERAVRVLAADFKVIYVVREPVARAVSHHRHDIDAGRVARSFDEELAVNPGLIDFGRYGMQLRPWLDRIGSERIMVLRMECYAKRRVELASEVQRFLGLDLRPDLVDPNLRANAGDAKTIDNRLSRLVASNPLYRRLMRPILGETTRTIVRRVLGSRSKTPSAVPSADSVDRILRATREDVAEIGHHVRFDVPDLAGAWSSDQVRERYDSQRIIGQTE